MVEKVIDDLIKSFFNQTKILVRHQIESYDDFIDNIIPNIFEQFFPLVIESKDNTNIINSIKLSVDNIIIGDAYCIENNGCSNILTPQIARLRNYSYCCSLYIDITSSVTIKENGNLITLPDKVIKNVLFGKIPLMVNSKYCMSNKSINNDCKYDIGGYMIINGNEKVIISQERISNNTIQVFQTKRNNIKYSHVAEVRSCHEKIFNIPKLISIKITNKVDKFDNEIKITIPNIKYDIPVIILFRLYGCLTDKEILYHIIDNTSKDIDDVMIKVLLKSFEASSNIRTEADAYKYMYQHISKNFVNISEDKKYNYIKNNILKNVLPHLNTTKQKLLFLGKMINKLIKCNLNLLELDDRDSYFHKRVDTPGILMGSLTYLCINKIVNDIKIFINKEMVSGLYNINDNQNLDNIVNDMNISKIIKSSYIETCLKSALATGSWGIKTGNGDKAGVSQVLNRLTYSSCLSHLRRIATTADITGKLIPPRKLHATSWGYICPTETPEGQSVGLVKNMSISSYITNKLSSEPVRDLIKDKIIDVETIDIYTFDKFTNTTIYINGEICGFTYKLQDLVLDLKEARNNGIISIYISFYICYKNNSLYISSDKGRCMRPLLKVNNKTIDFKGISNKLKNNNNNWLDLLINTNYIEYIDINEVNNILICPKYKDIKDKNYTHCEISASMILGVVASCIPFAHHNQSPRNTYQSAMGKQAIGIHSTNFNNRFDTFSHVLNYPQNPLISTKYLEHFNLNKLPNGINVVVAIMSYGGYNQEDSVLINKGAIDRGLFTSTFYRCYREEEKKNQLTGEEDIFCKPVLDEVLFPKHKNYDNLEEDGFVKPNTFVSDNDIIIGKIMPIKNNIYNYRDTSINVKNNENGYVDKNYINTNGDGFKFCKVRIRSTRVPEIGDKFSSRHGQKGTCGMIYDQCDMPFTKDGIVPDIIINPHAVPSRMTIAQLLECILGKTSVHYGYNGDGTVFNEINTENISNALEDVGFERNGNEVMYSGITGEQLKTSIFIGPTYYQRLKHMSGDKVHSRSSGPVVSMTRQPAEGRSSHGGLRFGEMERDCMIAHGSSYFLKERLMDVSDKFTTFICDKCGVIAISSPINNNYHCNSCNNYSSFTKINIPYSCKLLFQELQCMSIVPRFKIDNKIIK